MTDAKQKSDFVHLAWPQLKIVAAAGGPPGELPLRFRPAIVIVGVDGESSVYPVGDKLLTVEEFFRLLQEAFHTFNAVLSMGDPNSKSLRKSGAGYDA